MGNCDIIQHPLCCYFGDSIDLKACISRQWCICVVELNGLALCDITVPHRSWLMTVFHLNDISLCLSHLWKHTPSKRVFCFSRSSVELSCAFMVAMLFISVQLWLVLCQLVASVIGCSWQGHDLADGSPENFQTPFLYLNLREPFYSDATNSTKIWNQASITLNDKCLS